MRFIIIIAIAFVLLIPLFAIPTFQQEAFAKADYGLSYSQHKFSNQPIVCIYEPNVPNARDVIVESWIKETVLGVESWQHDLAASEYNLKDRWNIHTQVISLEDQVFFDNKDCDVEIRFVKLDPNYTAAGWHIFQNGKSQISLVYTETEVCRTWIEGNIRYTEWCYKDDLVRSKALGNTATHEFGHAISLGHYTSDNPYENAEWSSDPVRSPSVMTEAVHYNEEKNKIRPIDINKVKEIYGGEGFGEPKQTTPQNSPVFESKTLGGFESLFTLESTYYKEPGNTYYLTISGKVTEKAYSKGQNILLTTTFPDGHDEEQKVLAVGSRNFATQMRVDSSAETGKYTISARYMGYDSETITFSILDASEKPIPKAIPKVTPEPKEIKSLPTWLKNNVKWWSQGSIDDQSFTQGIEYLISDGIINVPITEKTVSQTDEIPLWVRTNANWWAEGMITDSDFVKGIEYLVNSGIIQVK
ncbi:hypothetical protein C5F47_06040 [Nitrosopumilus cobalaminigenes]|uniref:Peptidase M10 metallopeptidase domain-containing protein n=1 Tax=Nitrosopumilus cobalaminigenes TaxID=1470066 RepID=A0A7D5QZ94_9ARCH|nr:hypothetical protein [Nitrosopumilus cobalaminigenes]QLH03140.1 hypothetical protein C5F47_06040 [Nitrosopumilus cobalaminigenes]